jgi:hypothetical protein
MRDRKIAIRQAQCWADEEQAEAMRNLPEEIRDAIDWAKVARNLGIDWPEVEMPDVLEHIERIVDYLYDDEACDFDFVEGQFREGHIFQSILRVSRWLCRTRAEGV